MTPTADAAVIWDVDGTLVDTAELHFRAWEELCRGLGRDFTRADFAATFGRRNPEIFRHLFGERFGDRDMDELGFRKEELYRAAARGGGVELLPGARALLEGLHAAGFRQAIGSSAPLANIELILAMTRSAAFFQAISSAEDTQRGKPDPQVFLVAAEKLGVPPRRCVVFEDAVAGVEAAKAGGMMCVAVTFVGHHPAEKLRAAGADRVVRSFSELSPDDVIGLIA
jgi:beta-phosphoglucomutase family hydrolase